MKPVAARLVLFVWVLSVGAAFCPCSASGVVAEEPLVLSVGQLIGVGSYVPTTLTIGIKGLTYENETMKEPVTVKWADIIHWRFYVPKLAEPEKIEKDYYTLKVETKTQAGKQRLYFVFSGSFAEAWKIKETLRKLHAQAEEKTEDM